MLWADNVRARRYFHPGCHRLEPYVSRGTPPHLPVTDAILGRIIQLPAGAATSAGDIERTLSILHTTLAHAGEVRARLRERERAGTRDYGKIDVR